MKNNFFLPSQKVDQIPIFCLKISLWGLNRVLIIFNINLEMTLLHVAP